MWGGSDGGSGSAIPTLPADAIEFNALNAENVARAALDSSDSLGTATSSREAGTHISIQDAMNMATSFVRNRDRSSRSAVNHPAGPIPCDPGGTIIFDSTPIANGETGSVTFVECNILDQPIINGSFSYEVNIVHPDVTLTTSGNLSFEIPPQAVSFSTIMNTSETVNLVTSDFSFSKNFSVSGLPTGVFMVTTTMPFEGNLLTGDVKRGQMLILGANNTQIRITIIATNTARIEVDDGTGTEFVIVTESCIL